MFLFREFWSHRTNVQTEWKEGHGPGVTTRSTLFRWVLFYDVAAVEMNAHSSRVSVRVHTRVVHVWTAAPPTAHDHGLVHG